jgi:hypothetical protein
MKDLMLKIMARESCGHISGQRGRDLRPDRQKGRCYEGKSKHRVPISELGSSYQQAEKRLIAGYGGILVGLVS